VRDRIKLLIDRKVTVEQLKANYAFIEALYQSFTSR
jgi:hypothetical protein